jgi:cellulose synthase (UDP-forming)
MSPDFIVLSDAALFGALIIVLVALCAACLSHHRTLDRLAFGAVVLLMLVVYGYYRIANTLPAIEWTTYALWPRLYLALELMVLLYTAMSIIVFMRRSDRTAQAEAAAARLAEREAVPAVDILICTYNEALVVLERSILAALAIDYPSYSVWVLDDGCRDWLRDFCESNGVHYVPRVRNDGAKAGNLQNGLEHSARVTNAPFVLVLDADFAPRKNILWRTIGLFEDDRVGLVQTPQFYYNADPIQHNLMVSQWWVDDQRIFFDVTQPSKDAWNAAFCVGTSFVVRRDAVASIGGMPGETVTEDLHLTCRLRQRGLQTVWLNERLSVGLSAESLSSYVSQRCRWALGTIQVALLADGPLRGDGYSFTDRAHFLHGLLYWLCRPFVVCLLAAPIMFYFFDLPAIVISPEAFLTIALPALVGNMIFHAWVSGGRSLPLFTPVAHLVTAVPVCWAIVRAFYDPFGQPFRVTAKAETRSEVQIHFAPFVMFATIISLVVIGIMTNQLSMDYNRLDWFYVGWGVLVSIHCFVAMLVCIELPRPEIDDQAFPADTPGRLAWGGTSLDTRVTEISVNGIVFERPGRSADLRVGQLVTGTVLAGLDCQCEVIEVGRRFIRVRILEEAATRKALIGALFSEPPSNVAQQGRFLRACASLVRRALGSTRQLLLRSRSGYLGRERIR